MTVLISQWADWALSCWALIARVMVMEAISGSLMTL